MIASLQSLRFIFMMMIFMSHFAYSGMTAFDAGGDCGVAFFFLLSGFVLSRRYGEEVSAGTFDYWQFFKSRMLKLYPLHLLCLLFFMVVSHSDFDLRVMLNLLLLQSWVPDIDYYFSCNSVAWFLSSLMFSYAVFPFFCRRVNGGWLCAILVCYAVAYFITPDARVNAVLYVNPLVRFVDFYLGMWLYRVYLRMPALHHPTGLEWLMVGLLIIALAAYPWVGVKFRNAPLYWLILMPLILVFAKGGGLLSKLLNSRSLLFLSSLTMPLFMTHQMVLGILLRRLPQMPVVAMLFVCILLTLTLSWLINIIFSQLFRFKSV